MKTKSKLTLYLILLLAAIMLMVVLFKLQKAPTETKPRDLPEIKESGILHIVTDYNTIGFHVTGDTIAGFQYELIKALERSWNIKVEIFLENSLDENLKGLSEGKYDIVARNIPVNTQLRDKFAFTQFINRNKQVLVQRKAEYNDSIPPIRQHLNLAKKTIWVHKDSPFILRIQNLSEEIGDTIYIEQNNIYEVEQLVMMVAGGDIDFTICDEKTAKQLAVQFPEIDIETDISFTQLESWAVRKESHILLDSLNNWFSTFINSKEFNKVYDTFY